MIPSHEFKFEGQYWDSKGCYNINNLSSLPFRSHLRGCVERRALTRQFLNPFQAGGTDQRERSSKVFWKPGGLSSLAVKAPHLMAQKVNRGGEWILESEST